MNTKKYITVLILILFIVPFCQSQNMKYPIGILPKVKMKLDSLYPQATNVILDSGLISDATQRIRINCNCKEALGVIALLFDTTGDLLNKDIYLHSLKDLPDTITSYIKKNLSSFVRFDNGYMIKSTNYKGEISYSVLMFQHGNHGNKDWQRYILKFKSTGEIISKKAIIQKRDR